MLYKVEALLGGSWGELAGITSATLSEAKNSIAKLELKLDPTSQQAANIKKGSRVRVQNLRNQRWAFYGRVLSRRESTGKGSDYISLTCEGCAAFLCDTSMWIDSRKGYFDGTNASYPVEIDEDSGSRTMGTGQLASIGLSQHNKTVGDNGGDEWKTLLDGIGVPSGYETTFTAEYTSRTYDFLASCAADCGAEFRGEYDGSKPTYRMARSLGKRGAPLKLADNVAKMVADDSMAGVVTRMVPYGDEYAKLKKTACKGVTVTGALSGDKWDGSAKTDTGSAAKMVRFDVEGAIKCVLKVGRRCKSYPMVFFTDKKLTSGGKVLKKYVPSSNSTADVTKRYPVPDDAKYCYVFGSGSACTTYGYYRNSAGVAIKKNYRTDLGFWAAKLTSSEIQALVDAYCPGATIGYTVDDSNDKNYYLAKNEAEYGVIEGTCLIEGQLNTDKITDPKKTVYSISDLKATKRRAKNFLKAALQELEASCRESIEVSVNGYDLYMAGVDGYEEMELYDICRATNERYGIDVDVEIVSLKRDLLRPSRVTLGLGTVAVRASTYGKGSSSAFGEAKPTSAGDDDDSEADDYATLAGQYAEAAQQAAEVAVEKADELDKLSYLIQVDSLAAGQMASDAYDTVLPITDAMRGLLADAQDQADSLTSVKESQSKTISLANDLARAQASYAYETEKSVVRWKQTYTADLDAWASEDPEVQAEIAEAYKLLYGANGTAEKPEADSAQGHLNAAKAANVEAASTEAEMRVELASANAYLASCESAADKATAAAQKAQKAYDALKKKTTAKRKELDAAKAARDAALAKEAAAKEKVDGANVRCAEAEANYTAAKEALADAEAKVATAQAEVDTAMNGIHQKYQTCIEQTAQSVKLSASKVEGLETKTAELEVTAEQISASVEDKASKSYVEQKANEVTSTIEAKGYQTASQVSSTVSQTLNSWTFTVEDISGLSSYMSFTGSSGTGTLTLGGSSSHIVLGGSFTTLTLGGDTSVVNLGRLKFIAADTGSMMRYGSSGAFVLVDSEVTLSAQGIGGGQLTVSTNGNVYCTGGLNVGNPGTSTSTANCRLTKGDGPGYIRYATGSSRRFKHDIEDINADYLDPTLLYNLPVRQFIFNEDYIDADDDRQGLYIPGFIAEEVAEHYPIAADLDAVEREFDNWNERLIIPGMLKLIQDQKHLIDALTARLDALESK